MALDLNALKSGDLLVWNGKTYSVYLITEIGQYRNVMDGFDPRSWEVTELTPNPHQLPTMTSSIFAASFANCTRVELDEVDYLMILMGYPYPSNLPAARN